MQNWRLVASILVGLGGCSDGAEDDEALARTQQCERLRDHLVELRLASATNLGNDREQHRAALTQAVGAQLLETCTKTTTKAQLDCALAARDAQAATDCNEPTTNH
jgi:predicted choloylglycine hydrolase